MSGTCKAIFSGGRAENVIEGLPNIVEAKLLFKRSSFGRWRLSSRFLSLGVNAAAAKCCAATDKVLEKLGRKRPQLTNKGNSVILYSKTRPSISEVVK